MLLGSVTVAQSRSLIRMPVDVSQWCGSLALEEVDEKPSHPLSVNYGSLGIEELGQTLTPTQVVLQP